MADHGDCELEDSKMIARSNMGTVDSNPIRGMDKCVVCVFTVLYRAVTPSNEPH
jgi:hypothetical protein